MSYFSFPQQLGKYRLDALLGQGAMGVVYKAFDTEIERDVAIKVIHAHLLTEGVGSELEQRFKHEVKAAARCQHPNIVTVFDYGFHAGSPYMVMEYVKGIDLQDFLKSNQFLNVDQSVSLILKVLKALYAAHSMGVVHRDIKPANIMLLDNGQIKVTDFGVAHIDTSDLTQVGDVMGTPSYMSPEARSGGKVTHLSDLYTTGLVLLELLIKHRLKIEQINFDTLFSELQKQNLPPYLTTELAKVLDKALQLDPQQRYPDALSFYKALGNCFETNSSNPQPIDDLDATLLQVKSQLQSRAVPQLDDFTEPSLSASDSALLQTQLHLVEKALTSCLGPIAKTLVKKQANNVSNMTELLDALINYIPSEAERESFIQNLASSGITITTSVDLPSDDIDNRTAEPSYLNRTIAAQKSAELSADKEKTVSSFSGLLKATFKLLVTAGVAYVGLIAYQNYTAKQNEIRKQERLLFAKAYSAADFQAYLDRCVICEEKQTAIEKISEQELKLAQQKQQKQEHLAYIKSQTIEDLRDYLANCELCLDKNSAEADLKQKLKEEDKAVTSTGSLEPLESVTKPSQQDQVLDDKKTQAEEVKLKRKTEAEPKNAEAELKTEPEAEPKNAEAELKTEPEAEPKKAEPETDPNARSEAQLKLENAIKESTGMDAKEIRNLLESHKK